MTRKPRKTRTGTAPGPAAAAPSYPPFTRFEEHRPAMIEEFNIEGMGIAPKE